MSSFYRAFRAVILRDNFIKEGDSVLVALSGGIDSMVLGSLLSDLRKDIDFKLNAAHVNYRLRGEESDAQEKLARDFSEQHQLPFFVARPDNLKSKEKENFQEKAREFRYHFFAETAQQVGAKQIAVAHHKEDQVETILANLLRGSSLKGLSGMPRSREIQNPKSKIQTFLIRPLLSFSKTEIQEYAAEHSVTFIEDSSNATNDYWRNRLRHELLPVVAQMRDGAFDKIVQLGDELRQLSSFIQGEALQWLESFAKKDSESYWLPRPRWMALPASLRLEILYQAIQSLEIGLKNVKRDHLARCEQLAMGTKTEGYYHLPEDLKFVRSGDSLLLSRGHARLKL